MPIAEIAGAISSVRSSLDLARAMVGLRDAEAFRAKSIELQGLILDSLDKAVSAREAQSAQLDRISALEAELAQFKAWDAEKARYELVALDKGSTAFMLKASERGASPPYWLCANCFVRGKPSYMQPQSGTGSFGTTYVCSPCGGKMNLYLHAKPEWQG